MTELHDAALRAGIWQVIEQRAKELKDAAKAELQALEVGDAVAGRWEGQVVAKASKVAGRTKLVVTDPFAFEEWLAAKHPSEFIRTPNPAFLKRLEKNAVDGVVIDAQGDVVPGVEIQEGDPYVSVRKREEAPFIVAQLLSAGRVGFNGIQALEPAPVDARAGDMRCMYCGRPGGCGGECAGSRAERQRNRWVEDTEAGAIG